MDNFCPPHFVKFFDGTIDFQPNHHFFSIRKLGNTFSRILHKFNIKKSIFYKNLIIDYELYVEKIINEMNYSPNYIIFPGITPGFDNSARRKENALIFINSSPYIFSKWLEHIKKNRSNTRSELNYLFINAWNEWAEGNHLEPCIKYKNEYLVQLKKAIIN
jgi:hypothetical protein